MGAKRRIEVIPGEKYGRLTVIKEVEPHVYPSGQKERKILCSCECDGKEIEVLLNSLRRGLTTSCGCYRNENVKKVNKKYNIFEINHNTRVVTGYTLDNRKFYFDENDLPKIEKYCWSIGANGYVRASDNKTNKIILMHRMIMDCPGDMIIDHIDHCRQNNCKSNLRICTYSDNSKNLSIAKNNSYGITGVFYDKRTNKWRANISINKKRMWLGTFDTKEEAAKARYEAELKYFGKYSINYEKLTQQQSNQQPSKQQNT